MRRRETVPGPLLWLVAALAGGCTRSPATDKAERPDGASGPTGALDAGGAADGGGAEDAPPGGGADAAHDVASAEAAPLPDGRPSLDSGSTETAVGAPGTLTLPIATYLDKLKGGWVGQMAAGRWMQSLEYNPTYAGRVVPATAVPAWTPSMINDSFGAEGDETWAEIPYLDALRAAGVLATWVDFGSSWRDSPIGGHLYSANLYARNNLKMGMQAPTSGYFKNTGGNADNQTWQMESNWSGMVAPGMVDVSLDINWRAGHVALFGDGVNGGQMITAMQSAAFYAKSVDEIVQAGRAAVPVGSKYRAMIEDVLQWHQENAEPSGFETVWQLLQDKWAKANRLCSGPGCLNTLDAKINGAYVLLGLLYGNGSFESSVTFAARGGQDGDCTANDVGGIIGAWLGLARLDPRYSSALSATTTYVETGYTFQKTIDVSTEAARAIVKLVGEVSGAGDAEVWTVPISDAVVAPILEQWPMDETAPPPALLDPTAQVSGRHVSFDVAATTAKGALAYQWYFGDLSHSTPGSSPAASHTYAQPGTYYVTAYVADTTGNTAWKAVSVTVP